MSKHQARITATADGTFYALVVRIDHDGQESVDGCYKGRHFATRAAAEKSTAAYIVKLGA